MTRNLDNQFGIEFLDDIREWIGDHYNPEEVFSQDKMESWAREWARKQDEWIPDPDKWAHENGYVKE